MKIVLYGKRKYFYPLECELDHYFINSFIINHMFLFIKTKQVNKKLHFEINTKREYFSKTFLCVLLFWENIL